MKSLADIPVGATARVLAIEGHDDIGLRLLEMGVTPGVQISLLGTAPLGDPLEFELRGYRLSLRRSEAARISVEAL